MKLIPSELPGSPAEQTSSACEILPNSTMNPSVTASATGWCAGG